MDEFPSLPWYNRVKDSKLLTEVQRKELAPCISSYFETGVSYVSSRYIDQFNVNTAIQMGVYRLMQKFKRHLEKKNPSFKLSLGILDGNYKFVFPRLTMKKSMPQLKSIIKGDRKLFSVACASVVAKVKRDELIKRVSLRYPGYFLEKNKGYGTAEHLRAIQRIGMSRHHRARFLRGFVHEE